MGCPRSCRFLTAGIKRRGGGDRGLGRQHWLCLQHKSDISQDLAFRGGIRSSSVLREQI